MSLFRGLFYSLVLFLIPMLLHGQSINPDAPLVKQYNKTDLGITFRADSYNERGSNFFVEANYFFLNRYSSLLLEHPYVWMGYEYKASDHWFLGLSEKVAVSNRVINFFTRGNLSHRGELKGINFIKEISLEHMNFKGLDFYLRANEVRVGTGLALVKQWTIGDREFGGRVYYRAFLNSVYGQKSSFYTRRVDKTRMRADVYYVLLKDFSLGLFATRDTDYYYSFLQNENRVNRISPLFGITLNYSYNRKGHIPLLPLQ